MTTILIENYWQAYLATLPDAAPARRMTYVAEGFGDNPALADELGALVVAGQKTATCSALWEWEAEGNPIAQVGDFWIVLNGRGMPLCITETVEVTIRRYDEVDADFAAAEGEGDRTLQYWRDAHRRFFTRILSAIDKEFSPEMPLVCERFRVVY
ncbi:ASCH domain-containing protein [Caldilinea sp.]|uniref:ASCH domain-containing protein n=1 Tax=Caldilinea sp. TaxID=2293560 RepID=UPI002B85DCBD|nr:ASCH domain-containing protein [Anaerolineales bacterium]HQY94726.1 ASCH domain-containing protein [Caldilinea sp.]HRA66519.1 ASCH domain-containing protein [Caldilinea sp.]